MGSNKPTPDIGDRSDIWLPLLTGLSAKSDSWLVYKNVDSALFGLGDIDASASPDDWTDIISEYRDWALGLGPSVVCTHIPGGLNLITAPTNGTHVLEMGMKARKSYRGSILFSWSDLVPLSIDDDRGFRKLRPGAEGLLKLLFNGVNKDGSRNAKGLVDKGVAANLNADPEGITDAAHGLLPPRAAAAAIHLAQLVAEDGWDRAAANRIQLSSLLRAMTQPRFALERARFRSSQGCPVTDVLLGQHRRIPDDRTSWWNSVVETHPEGVN